MEQKPAGDNSGDMQKPPEYILTPPPDSTPPVSPAAPPSHGPDKYCPNCGTPNPADSTFCHKCGAKLPESAVPEKKICAGCGAQNALTAEYCYKCGLKLPETAAAYKPLKYGGFWLRLLAYLIDSVLLSVFTSIVASPLLLNYSTQLTKWASEYKSGDALPSGFWQFYLIYFVITFAVMVIYQTVAVGKWGKTLGKAALGLKVVKPDGSKVSFIRALGRALAYQLNAFTLGLAILMIPFSHKKRGLHDYIADTIVVKTN